ncbi:class I SAM-dependent DNA methyltransferase [Jannaschia sp. CCS1]|uniref:class I SAM-dependent DNA methyltransferase n=1 Tax=Jannaschia sp. (strain CCS1) TaxID=290400 RepID=UPI000053B59D|nr:methyltransferase domain-containing protein [Jannaschia sp. CCS1]ABD55416.1 Methyltransferase type 12 [Jannaschia sp. CCS1]
MKSPIDAKLWTPRSVEDTQALYADWAQAYDADMARMSYATPTRIAEALASVWPKRDAPVLDFGCGTGLSGAALRAAGFARIDGTDISPEMLDVARYKALYDTLHLGIPGDVPGAPGDYSAIVATGVVSLGAAPPSMLRVLLDALIPGGRLAFSFNDPTLNDPTYTYALANVLADNIARVEYRAHGPHLSEKVTGSDVIVLLRQ